MSLRNLAKERHHGKAASTPASGAGSTIYTTVTYATSRASPASIEDMTRMSTESRAAEIGLNSAGRKLVIVQHSLPRARLEQTRYACTCGTGRRETDADMPSRWVRQAITPSSVPSNVHVFSSLRPEALLVASPIICNVLYFLVCKPSQADSKPAHVSMHQTS
jgi:hypothetical protein